MEVSALGSYEDKFKRFKSFEHVCIVRDYVTIVRIARQLNLKINEDYMYWYNGVDQNTVRFRKKEMLAEFILAAAPGEISGK